MSGAEPQMHPAVEELMNRQAEALALFFDQSMPKWDRTQKAMRVFANLPLDQMPPEWQRRIDVTFQRVNLVLARYQLETWDDYQKIGADDLDLIRDILMDIPRA